jgi:ppGpp synthetase/RelA/SpoT-type nucleotidyltranferase
MEDHLIQLYVGSHSLYAAFTDALRRDLERALEYDRLKIQLVTQRTKHPDSLAEKLARKEGKYRKLDDITDLAGVRAVLLLESQLPYVTAQVRKHFVVDESNSPDHTSKRVDEFGYRSVHFVVMGTAAGDGEIDRQEFSSLRGEIQIRTLLAHAWGELMNDLGYKSAESMSEGAKRRMNRVAALLELCDREFVEVRSLRWNTAKWREAPRPAGSTSLALALQSLQDFIRSSTLVLQLDLALATKLGMTMHDEGQIENLEPLLSDLRAVGFADTGAIEDALWARRSEIVSEYDARNAGWGQYLTAFPESHGNASVPRGYCLYYLLMVLGRR